MTATSQNFSAVHFSELLGWPVSGFRLLKENRYCFILKLETSEGLVIVKQYKGDNPALAIAEADGLNLYHSIAEKDSDLIDSRPLKLIPEKNFLAIGFVEGQPLSDLLYKSHKEPLARKKAVNILEKLGLILAKIHLMTHHIGSPSPFLLEYFRYSSEKLSKVPVLGNLFFRGVSNDVDELWNSLIRSESPVSFVHGDFVFLNIHVSGNKVGLIDFANTNRDSHLLNDLYNMRFALENMLLPSKFKQELKRALYKPVESIKYPDAVHKFYHEYHRRRWLMLKLTSSVPKDKLQGIRGMLSFAKSYSEDRVGS